tara:strand:+ start:921 stop:1109 length:189 start_codon:yes stop_codon:yes gene_type:complete
MKDFKTIQWGWEQQTPMGMRSEEHIAFLLKRYNEGKPESEHVTTMAQLNRALLKEESENLNS